MRHIVSFSGGKDSTAMLLKMIEEDWQIDKILYADVGEEAEFEEMYEFIDKVEAKIGRKITRVKSEKWTWDKIFYSYPIRGKTDTIRGFPPVANPGCRYRSWLKIEPLEKAQGEGNLIYIGIAADEAVRALAKQYQGRKNKYRFPLIEWGMTERDCIEYCKDNGLLNPLYEKFRRLGCWQCSKQSLSSFRALYQHYPQKWEKLRLYQAACPWPITPDYSVAELEDRFYWESRQVSLF